MKTPSFFVACLLIVALANAFYAGRRLLKTAHVPLPMAETIEGFQSKVNTTSDTNELRNLAVDGHRRFLAADDAVQTSFSAIDRLSKSQLVQGIIMLFLSICVYFESPRRE